MGGLFYRCRSLPYVDTTNFDTSNVIYMDSMFEDMNALRGTNSTIGVLDLRNFNTSKVTSMFTMFYNTPSLKEVDVSSNFVIGKETNTSSMFERSSCKWITYK